MQPYLFPYIGYWQLLNAVDTFVIYDNIQFSKKGWFHRNNLLLNGKKTTFSIPLKKDSDFLDVRDRLLAETSNKQIQKIIAQIEHSYRKAPYFNKVFPLVKEILKYKNNNLFEYIYNSVVKICNYLDVETQIIISSTVNIDHSLKSQDRVIALNKALNARQYINPISGTELYDSNEFKKENIDLKFLESEVPEYQQFDHDFMPYLSIIDVMMFNSRKEIKRMLAEDFKILSKKDLDS